MNDADAAVAAEVWVGAARGKRHAVMMSKSITPCNHSVSRLQRNLAVFDQHDIRVWHVFLQLLVVAWVQD